MKRRWLLSTLCVCAVQPVSAAWLGVCTGEGAVRPGKVLAEYVSPKGARIALAVSAAPLPNCAAVELPFEAETVVAGRLVAPGIAAPLVPGFGLIGRATGQNLQASEIVLRDGQGGLAAVPAGVELSGDLTAISFGAENRATARREHGRITLVCGAGERAAGMVLRLPYRGVPRAVSLVASVGYAADGSFEWGISDARRAASSNPLLLATLSAATSTSLMNLGPAEFDAASVESMTVACPRQPARFELRSLRIKPSSEPARAPLRALWEWHADAWTKTPEALLDKLGRAGADTVFMTVPVDLSSGVVAQPRVLETFVEAASRRGVRVWAVVGDPGAVIESERAGFALYPAAYARYNRIAPAGARLAGVQYDIEPYLNAAYSLDSAAWQEAYLATLRELRRAADLPIDVAVPYWWADQQTSGGPLLERLAPLVESVTVMNYRTDPAQTKRFAQPFLEWGARHARAVRIALESGPIADAVQQHYQPARSGEAALIAIGPHRAMLEFDRTLSMPDSISVVQTLRRSHVTPVPGNRSSFAGRRGALLALLPELERLWSAWPGFAGIALHEFEP